jgi:hypothetical protein
MQLLVNLPSSQEAQKLIDTQSCLTNDSSQCATIKLLMIWNHNLSKRDITAKYDVAASLPFKVKARVLEGFYAIVP